MPVYKDAERDTWYVHIKYRDILTNEILFYKKRGFESLASANKHDNIMQLKIKEETIVEYYWEQVCDLYLESKKGKVKDRSYYDTEKLIDKHVKPAFEKKRITKINAMMIEKWQENLLKSKYKNSYLEQIQQTASSVFNYAAVRTIVPLNPLKIVGFVKNTNEAKRKMMYFTFEQYKNFRSSIDEVLFQDIFDILYYTGMRVGELQALTWEDYDRETKLLHLHSNWDTKNKKITKTTKNGEDRYVYLNDDCLAILNRIHSDFIKYSDFSKGKFIFGYYEVIPQKTIENQKNYAIDKFNEVNKEKIKKGVHTELPKIRIHDLRHSHVSLLVNKNVPSAVIAERMGHSIHMVETVYSHMFESSRKSVLNVLNNL
ncbi:MAG: tyrosine-type recombinase/integrase [Anaerorhabdus sp.]|uniref:tyrosine-type recombinase/integrase n=1 Tax=Anaerorhabdus sp. TaxID=1872524 RepID=UPI003A87C87B